MMSSGRLGEAWATEITTVSMKRDIPRREGFIV
jgi:hypothetical protein